MLEPSKMKRFTKVVRHHHYRRLTLTLTITNFSQLSRGKDPSRSSKKNKESKDGTASPQSNSRDSANQSPSVTPSSSTSNLTDPRNKALPPNAAGVAGDHAAGQPSNLSNVVQQGSLPDRFGPAGGASSPNNGNVNARLPPAVIISPTPGVRYIDARCVLFLY